MNFRYRGRNSDGGIVEEQVEAENQGQALESLRQKSILVLSMNAREGGETASGNSMSLLDKVRNSFACKSRNTGIAVKRHSICILRPVLRVYSASCAAILGVEVYSACRLVSFSQGIYSFKFHCLNYNKKISISSLTSHLFLPVKSP